MPVLPAIARRFAVYLALLIAGLLGIVWPLISGYEDNLRTQQLISAHGRQRLLEQLIHRELFERSSDVRLLAQSPLVWDMLRYPDASARNALESYLAQIATEYRAYGQLSLLNAAGRELVRVNYQQGQSQVVGVADLQDVSAQAFYKTGATLEAGEVYVSPLDLAVEYGRIRVPYQPTVRLAAALRDEPGVALGVLVLHYEVTRLLDVLRADDPATSHQTMLVNNDGFWLSHPDPGLEWGWQLGHPEHSFAAQHPQLWPAVHRQEAGEVSTPEGVFLFHHLLPLDFAATPLSDGLSPQQVGLARSITTDYHWHLVTFVPRQAWLSDSLFRQTRTWIVLASLLLIATAGLWALARSRALASEIIAERLRNEQALDDLYENAPCGYHSTDARGRVQRMNRTELDWLGYAREDIVGRVDFIDLVAPEDRAGLQQCFERFAREGDLADHTLQLLRKDGQRMSVSLSATALRNAQGELLSCRTTVLDATERHRLAQELEREARTDSLTGMFNRRQFNNLAEREISRARREGRPLSLLMIDIDLFKTINDRFGHAAGDLALKTVAQTCSAQLRGHDVFARMGGEEFAALLTQSGPDAAAQVAERIRAAVQALTLTSDAGEAMALTVSVGVASDAQGQSDLEDLLRRADANLYRAKNAGRNRVCT